MLEICLAYTYCDVKCTYPSWKFFQKTADIRNNRVTYCMIFILWLGLLELDLGRFRYSFIC